MPSEAVGQEQAAELSPAALRAASIFAIQREASSAYFIDEGAADNPAQNLRAKFDEDGVVLSGHSKSYQAGLALAAVRRGKTRHATQTVQPTFVDNEARYARPALGLSEWYLNGPLGLEQGFDLATRPVGDANADLVIEIALSGNLQARQVGTKIALQDDETTLLYSELYVSDANDAPVAASLKLVDDTIEIHVVDASASYPLRIDPIIYEQTDKLKASDDSAGAGFGVSIAIDGDLAIVGAQGAAMGVGAAYVFVRSGDQWTEEAKLVPGDTPAGALFGSAVALQGDYAAIGAKGDDFSKGAVYVFKRASMAWTEQIKLKASDAQGADQLGYSIALDGDTVVAGAPGEDEKAAEAGAAYVFHRDTMDAWSEQAKLTVLTGAQTDQVGRSVAIVGDVVTVGAPYANEMMLEDVGAVYTFTRDMMDAWTEDQKLQATTPAQGAKFGWSIAMSGSDLAIGAPMAVASTISTAGAVYVFTADIMGVYSEQQRLEASMPAVADHLGWSVDIDGDLVIAGVPEDDGKATNTGSAYVFERSGMTWAEAGTITTNSEAQEDTFGRSVAIAGQWALIGAPGYDGAGGGSGIAYAFKSALALGSPCTMGGDCNSGFCVDDVCCDTVCAGGDGDCQACSMATGAVEDGTCGNSTGNTCDDADGCTQTDTCQDGTCTGADPVMCTGADECNEAGTCDAASGMCTLVPKPDGTECTGGTCQTGACVPGASSGSGAGGSSGSGSTGSGAGGSDAADDAGGCGCRVVASPDGEKRPVGMALLLLGAGLLLRRRRRD